MISQELYEQQYTRILGMLSGGTPSELGVWKKVSPHGVIATFSREIERPVQGKNGDCYVKRLVQRVNIRWDGVIGVSQQRVIIEQPKALVRKDDTGFVSYNKSGMVDDVMFAEVLSERQADAALLHFFGCVFTYELSRGR